jgi:hypothetical protein
MKYRAGFVSKSSSSSFLTIGVSDSELIDKLIKAVGFKLNENGYYDNEGYGVLAGKHVVFYGNSEYWQAAGFDESKTRDLLEEGDLTYAREHFQKYIKNKLGLDIPLQKIDLIFGEISSE